MTSHLVRSGRTAVLGDSPVSRGLREVLAARGSARDGVLASGSASDEGRALEAAAVADDPGTAALVGAQAVVVVGQTGDFAPVAARRVAERRDERALRVRAAVAAAAAAGVEHVVGISSAMVEGAAPDRALIDDPGGPVGPDGPVDPGALDGPDAPGPDLDVVLASPGSGPSTEAEVVDGGAAGDLRAFEVALVAAAAEHGIPHVTVLRPAVLVGPGVDTLLTRHFEAPRILTVRGARREWQLVHVDDLGAAVALVVGGRLTGVLTVGAVRDGVPDVLSPEEVVTVTGLRTVDLPAAVAFGTAERLHRLGVLPAPASDLACTVYPWTVTSRRLVAAGWAPTWSSRACLEVLVEQARGRVGVGGRRVARRDAAALGAAGAAVALLGTAAVWRQARGRR